MEVKDGSFGFDFEVKYSHIVFEKEFTYEFEGRLANVKFINHNKQTEIVVTFNPENQNSVEMQKNGWQTILNNFIIYTENN
ncbi:MAG: hypothetical protein JST29_07470 [Bacteroidetes bacterium]|nr:hypothetical protein [Bacteroidota bacterium]MBS1590990.1 hypothetical protein [Bacteroidota bacterium]